MVEAHIKRTYSKNEYKFYIEMKGKKYRVYNAEREICNIVIDAKYPVICFKCSVNEVKAVIYSGILHNIPGLD